jgi:hypothetical protein
VIEAGVALEEPLDRVGVGDVALLRQRVRSAFCERELARLLRASPVPTDHDYSRADPSGGSYRREPHVVASTGDENRLPLKRVRQ